MELRVRGFGLLLGMCDDTQRPGFLLEERVRGFPLHKLRWVNKRRVDIFVYGLEPTGPDCMSGVFRPFDSPWYPDDTVTNAKYDIFP